MSTEQDWDCNVLLRRWWLSRIIVCPRVRCVIVGHKTHIVIAVKPVPAHLATESDKTLSETPSTNTAKRLWKIFHFAHDMQIRHSPYFFRQRAFWVREWWVCTNRSLDITIRSKLMGILSLMEESITHCRMICFAINGKYCHQRLNIESEYSHMCMRQRTAELNPFMGEILLRVHSDKNNRRLTINNRKN